MRIFKTIRSPFYNTEGGAGADGGQESGKTFTQADIDRIVGERLAREKAKYSDHEDIVQMVKQFGYSGNSAADIKAQLQTEYEQRQKEQELHELQQEAKEHGTDPDLLKEIKELKKELSEIKQESKEKKEQIEKEKAAVESFGKQVSDFKTKYPDVDFENLDKNEKFVRFAKRSHPSLSLVDIYEDFIDLASGAEKEAIAKIQSSVNRSTSSGRGKGEAEGGTYGLTPRQQQLAKIGDMTYKEFADRLKPIQNL